MKYMLLNDMQKFFIFPDNTIYPPLPSLGHFQSFGPYFGPNRHAILSAFLSVCTISHFPGTIFNLTALCFSPLFVSLFIQKEIFNFLYYSMRNWPKFTRLFTLLPLVCLFAAAHQIAIDFFNSLLLTLFTL